MKKEKNSGYEDEIKCEEYSPGQEENQEEGCKCGEECDCSEKCACQSKEAEYLEMAKRIQAEFENFRKRTDLELTRARQEGEISVIEAFLPCLDTFKIAKKSITDPTVLEGVEMIETNIFQTLQKLGVEKIEAVGQPYDHNLHNVIALTKVDDKEDGIILDEYQAGYKYKDKVIRYSKVIVNKKED